MVSKVEKEAAFRFRACIAKERQHVRVGDRRNDGTQVWMLGTVTEMHGPDGCCTCCHERGSN